MVIVESSKYRVQFCKPIEEASDSSIEYDEKSYSVADRPLSSTKAFCLADSTVPSRMFLVPWICSNRVLMIWSICDLKWKYRKGFTLSLFYKYKNMFMTTYRLSPWVSIHPPNSLQGVQSWLGQCIDINRPPALHTNRRRLRAATKSRQRLLVHEWRL